jgi:hypothetical protein
MRTLKRLALIALGATALLTVTGMPADAGVPPGPTIVFENGKARVIEWYTERTVTVGANTYTVTDAHLKIVSKLPRGVWVALSGTFVEHRPAEWGTPEVQTYTWHKLGVRRPRPRLMTLSAVAETSDWNMTARKAF